MTANNNSERELRRICVYCGSSSGRRPEYAEGAKHLARILAAERIGLVYGGASVGIMGMVADAALAEGGEVIGVIPQDLVDWEVAHHGLTDLQVVGSMHERKARMAELSDAFVALPGGLGTLEEVFEVLTWAQLGIHQKPCGLLNIGGYYDQLSRFLDHAVSEEFIRTAHRTMLIVEDEPEELLRSFAAYQAPGHGKRIANENT